MKSNNLIKYLKNIEKGICKVCGNPKGHFGFNDQCICYKCNGYELISSQEAKLLIHRNKRRIREEFRKISIKADIFYCLKLFLSIGETFFINEENGLSIRPDLKNQNKNNILIIDPRRIAIANIGIKWLLEDSLVHSQKIVPWNVNIGTNLMNLVRTWLDWNRKEKLSDIRYRLGFFVSEDNKTSFYYTRQYDFYLDSLKKFNITEPSEEFSEEMIDNVFKLHKDLFHNPDKLRKYVRDEYPAIISTVLNSYYTDDVIRPFSFDDLLDKNHKKMSKFLSKCNPELREFLRRKKRKFPELILALLEKLYSFYDNKRPTSEENITKDGFIVVRDLKKLTADINQGSLLIPPFQDSIISSPQNYHNYPFIIEYNHNFIISPSRLWIGYRLLHYAFQKDRINNQLAKKYEKESMKEIENCLKKHGVIIVGKEIHTCKKGIELDLIGYYNEYILIIECKSFHPSPFFMMRKNRRYNDQFRRKLMNIEKIKDWMFQKLSKAHPNKGKFRIYGYDSKNKRASELIFPLKYNNIEKNKILFLYITQIKEYYEENRGDIIQVWHGDL